MKVYCKSCRYYSCTSHGNYCDVVDSTGADWYSPTSHTFRPYIQNSSNDCEFHQHKRGLVEWLNDLLQVTKERR